jgi:hypothetical protein
MISWVDGVRRVKIPVETETRKIENHGPESLFIFLVFSFLLFSRWCMYTDIIARIIAV